MQYDYVISIATGKSRRAKKWDNDTWPYSKLVKQLQRATETEETYEEYIHMDREKQNDIKDVGGFVGGVLKDGIRKSSNVESRSIITLDVDNIESSGFIDSLNQCFDFAFCYYTTHKHTPEKPRYRVIIPLKRPVSAEAYPAVARKLAERIGIECMDPTTYQAGRLMYWPSKSRDGEFDSGYNDDEWIDPDKILAEYDDWKDQTQWPTSSREKALIKREIGKKMEDPENKKGIIGAFCRAYSVQEAIEKFLPDVYTPTKYPDRYTYAAGSTAGGLVIYDDKFAYSHHATDLVCERTLNAFDLVRIHKFGELDEDKTFKSPTRAPSFGAMREFLRDDVKVYKADNPYFDDLGADQDENLENVLKAMTKNGKTQKPLNNLNNIDIAFKMDENLKGLIGYNMFADKIAYLKKPQWTLTEPFKVGIPWGDDSSASIRNYLGGLYGFDKPRVIDDLISENAKKHKFHPVRDWLKELPEWDGKKRLETLFIDCLGAEDDEYGYVRQVARKLILGLISRVMHPGCKFDYVVALTGKQGLGKSTFLSKLAIKDEWFSDSLSDIRGKEAYMQLRGKWLLEIQELSALRKSDNENTKRFFSQRYDTYRPAYGKYTKDYKRQCVLVGTTNEMEYLSDPTGNRRYLPVLCGQQEPTQDIYDDEYFKQVYAEGMIAFKNGEKTYLSKDMEEVAAKVREPFTSQEEWLGEIEDYLERELPESWYDMAVMDRRDFIKRCGIKPEMGKSYKRTRVCAKEIWDECVGNNSKMFDQVASRKIGNCLRELGWEAIGTQRFKDYGVQRAFEHVTEE